LGKYVENAILLCELHPRPAEWLLCHHQISAKSMTILDLRKFSDAKAAMDAVMAIAPDRARASQGTDRLRDALDSSPGRIEQLDESCGSRWYPVVDFSRCTGCLDCLQFCLFGVYEQDPQGKLVVRNPDKCKPGCPACSRICPQSAIMFPLFGDAAIAGASGQWITPEGADDGAPIARGAKNVTVLASEPLPFDDLDLLVEQLDQQTKRRG
jgi:NAD-dependent dihydropyrimidine dehydrogenase PreA subunit